MSDSDSFDLAKLALNGDKIAQRIKLRIPNEIVKGYVRPSALTEESAYKLLTQLDGYLNQPDIFLNPDNGFFLFKWSSPKEVLSVEIQEGKFTGFYSLSKEPSIYKEGCRVYEIFEFVRDFDILNNWDNSPKKKKHKLVLTIEEQESGESVRLKIRKHKSGKTIVISKGLTVDCNLEGDILSIHFMMGNYDKTTLSMFEGYGFSEEDMSLLAKVIRK